MAAELIKSVLAAEAKGRSMEQDANKKREKMISDARIQADIIVKTSIEQAKNEAKVIISEALYQSEGQIKQAEKLAELREKKSIADTEKQYETAIQMIFEEWGKGNHIDSCSSVNTNCVQLLNDCKIDYCKFSIIICVY